MARRGSQEISVSERIAQGRELDSKAVAAYGKVLTIIATQPDEVAEFVSQNEDDLFRCLEVLKDLVPTPKRRNRSPIQRGMLTKIQQWEDSLELGVHNFVTYPDGTRGIYIKHSQTAGNWYELTSFDQTPARMTQIAQAVIGLQILKPLVVGHDYKSFIQLIGKEKFLGHITWIHHIAPLFKA